MRLGQSSQPRQTFSKCTNVCFCAHLGLFHWIGLQETNRLYIWQNELPIISIGENKIGCNRRFDVTNKIVICNFSYFVFFRRWIWSYSPGWGSGIGLAWVTTIAIAKTTTRMRTLSCILMSTFEKDKACQSKNFYVEKCLVAVVFALIFLKHSSDLENQGKNNRVPTFFYVKVFR